MRSDRRKALEAAARKQQPAPIGVGRDTYGDWIAACAGGCSNPLDMAATDWHDAYEAALGHACLHHGSAS